MIGRSSNPSKIGTRNRVAWRFRGTSPKVWVDEHGKLPLSDWDREGRVQIVKSGSHRTVYRVELPTETVFIKHYRCTDWRSVLQNLIRPCKARLEWNAALQVHDAGLSTIEPLGVGTHRRWGVVADNFLITREIPDAVPMDEYFLNPPPGDSTAKRRHLANQLGELVAILHRNRLYHKDLHPGNILITNEGHKPTLFLIDLHAVQKWPWLTRSQRGQNIALLHNFFARIVPRTDQLRFLNAYARTWNQHASTGKQFTGDDKRTFAKICRAELANADQRGDRKWQRGNRRLIILERCRGIAELGRQQLEVIQADPDRFFANAIAHQQPVELRVNDEKINAEVIQLPSGRAQHAWEMGHAIRRRRFQSACPLLFVESRTSTSEFLVLEQTQAVTLHDALNRKERMRGKIISTVARELRRLHDLGFCYPNFSHRHVAINFASGPPRIEWTHPEELTQQTEVDLDRVRGMLLRFFESMSISISQVQIARFLRSYFGASWKTEWRAIAKLQTPNAFRRAA